MSLYAFTESGEAAGAGDAAARHLRIWLAATGRSYDEAARELFVRAHPVLFGRDWELTLRGYDRWRWRRRLHDTAASFGRYIAPRHERWLAARSDGVETAPCLIASGGSAPCWALGWLAAVARDELESAA